MDAKELLKAWLMELIDAYLTEELIQSSEKRAKQFAISKLEELVDKTENEVDDLIVEKVKKAWELD